MKVLLTNDDGVHAQGIIQLARQVHRDAEVFIVAPRTEQSGIAGAITFLQPLFPIKLGGDRDVRDNDIPGYSVDGTPVDCVKLALFDLCPWQPDIVISGINGGLNAGTNVNHSGTVGAALVAAAFGVKSFAISVEHTYETSDYEKAAAIGWPLIKKLAAVEVPKRTVINVNIPATALTNDAEVVTVPVETQPMAYHYAQGIDPKQRPWYWSTNDPVPARTDVETDTAALLAGKITVSAICSDLNSPAAQTILDDHVACLKAPE
jgi:5'-nucleotidase